MSLPFGGNNRLHNAKGHRSFKAKNVVPLEEILLRISRAAGFFRGKGTRHDDFGFDTRAGQVESDPAATR
jgi:hypothetical protein